jgi:rhodanese-related sulfurtransferase
MKWPQAGLGKIVFALLRDSVVVAVAVLVYFAVSEWKSGKDIPDSTPNSPPQSAAGVPIAIGAPVLLEGKSLARGQRTLILISSPNCPYCRNSLGFHSRLIQTARASRVSVRILLPDPKADADFRNQLGGEALPWNALNLRVHATPTILLAGGGGTVERIWRGYLGPGREQELLGLLNGSRSLDQPAVVPDSGYRNLAPDRLGPLLASRRATLLDVRERTQFAAGSTPGALNIHLAELPVRAAFELEKSRLAVVDCGAIPSNYCSRALSGLADLGFAVAAHNYAQREFAGCSVTKVPPNAED